ncbi:MAG: carboxypeptidase-like regulatory domain-containing protein [Gemmatimonadetes bacterium]|nr:carboxypeptidase-like regulatory domain-containing protein [Candidatus Palauibacter rhopaloidicola]
MPADRGGIRLTIATIALVVLQSAVASAVHGQVVRGRLVDEGDNAAISGAMITLVDRAGRGVERMLTRSGTGVFELRIPAPGEYRLRAERIGYGTTYSAFFIISTRDTLTVQMAAPIEAISLAEISVSVRPQCHLRPEEGLAVARVWDEARKALAAARWTQERGLYRYEMLGIKRFLDQHGRRVEAEDRAYGQALVSVPYVARAADSLVHGGFARFSADASDFWGPDAGVLLSDPFLDTHCLRIRSGVGGLVGLEFEPVPNRNVADIAGTMWLDAATAELQRVDYRYVNLPVPDWLMEASPGGTVSFRGLPDGTWIVTSWNIRMFTAGETEHPLTGQPAATLEGVAITHGEVLRAHGDAGVVFEGHRGRRVAATVVDSLGVGLPNARVYVRGSGTEAETDAEGRFELDHLGVGTYALQFTHPHLEQLWYESEPVEVEVGPDVDSLVEVQFEAPPLSDVLSAVCGREGPPSVPMVSAAGTAVWRTGILIGRVTDTDGNPIEDATLHLLTRASDPRLFARVSDPRTVNLEEQRSRWTEKSSSSGFYRVCWLPSGVPIELVVLGKDEDVDRDALDASLSLADLFPDRVTTLTIDPASPQRALNLRLEIGGRDDPR